MPINLEHLEQLEAEWKSLQPLAALPEERLWQKLRLEWNYHSNHIEGNTLTYGETANYLLHGATSGNHSIREYAEMKGHDLAIELVRELAASPQDITEADIRNVNLIILKEPFYKDAITLDGAPTRKLITPGRYKEEPNSVRTSTGELFEYASPTDVPTKMAKLLEALRSAPSKSGIEFLAALAITHHEFTLIHPFDDGNGRVARLVTNYVLLKKGLPPLVIPSERKKDYLSALRLADGGDPASLADFFAENLLWSLELGIKAAKGESLEEPSDIDKEIALFVREQKSQSKKVVRRTNEIIASFLTSSVVVLFEKFETRTKAVGELFSSSEQMLISNDNSGHKNWRDRLNFLASIQAHKQTYEIGFNLSLKGYLASAPFPFRLDQQLNVRLDEFEYKIEANDRLIHRDIYTAKITEKKADEIMSDFLQILLTEIKKLTTSRT